MNRLGNCWWMVAGPLAAGLLVVSAASAQVVVRDGGWQQPYTNPLGQSLQWVNNTQMEKELEVVPEQKEALAKLRAETYEKMRTLWTGTGEGDQQERLKKYYEATRALSDETEKKVREILLPHQLRRLAQVALQMKLAQTGYGGTQAIATGEVAEELGITDEQRALLKEKEQEVMKEIREKTQEFYKKLQEESREKLLSVLTPSQRKKLTEMTGDKFEWQPQVVGGQAAVPTGGGAAPAPIRPIELKRPAEEGNAPLKRLPQGD
jgi:Spy/CpxP family protein refolding chaperone